MSLCSPSRGGAAATTKISRFGRVRTIDMACAEELPGEQLNNQPALGRCRPRTGSGTAKTYAAHELIVDLKRQLRRLAARIVYAVPIAYFVPISRPFS